MGLIWVLFQMTNYLEMTHEKIGHVYNDLIINDFKESLLIFSRYYDYVRKRLLTGMR